MLANILKSNSFKVLRPLLNIIFCLGCVYLLSQKLSVNLWYQDTPSNFLLFIVLTMVAYLLMTLIGAWRWQQLLGNTQVGFIEFFKVNWLAQLTGLLTFGALGNELMRIWQAKKLTGQSLSHVSKASVNDRLFSLIGGGLFVSFAYAYYLNTTLILIFLLLFLLKMRWLLLASFSIHAIKTLCFFYILYTLHGLHSFPDISLALAVELIPISLDGFGTTHMSMKFLVSEEAVRCYSIFFLGKVCYKAAAFPLYWSRLLTV